MKIILMFLCLSVSAFSEDWTVDGRDYHNVKVGQVEADRVHISYDGGIGSVLLADLPRELQKKFDYDPEKAKAFAKQKEAEAAQVEMEALNASQFVEATGIAEHVLPTGFIGSICVPKGFIYLCFVKCNTRGMVDGQPWRGTVAPLGSFSFTDTQGGANTVAQFTTDPNATPLANTPTYHNAPEGSMHPQVSSTMAVGGG